MRKTEGREGDSHDNRCVRSRDSLHVLFDNSAMVILDLLGTLLVEVESIHMVVGGVD